MCLTPNILITGQTVGCRECWQCQQRIIDDWAGRCIAETKTSDDSYTFNLTYGRDDEDLTDHMRACVLTYSDVQKFWKKLRKARYKIRYILAGEYGSLNNRSHWHSIIFFTGKVPDFENEEEFQYLRTNKDGSIDYEWIYWEHGHVNVDTVHINSARYLTKYIRKDLTDEHAQSHFSVSKKPPIGTTYFKWLAEQYVHQGLAPQTPQYTFSDITNKKGEPLTFYMSKTVLRDFLIHYIQTWKQQRNTHIPNSELVEEFQDTQVEEILTLNLKDYFSGAKKKILNEKLSKSFEYQKFKKKYDENGNEIAYYSLQKSDKDDIRNKKKKAKKKPTSDDIYIEQWKAKFTNQ